MKQLSKFLLFLFLFITISENAYSQGPPPWAPAHGYRAKTRYVYFPDQNFYYDLQSRNYLYINGGNWSISASLPRIYVGINLGGSTQVELDFVGDRPYRYNSEHIVKYKVKKVKKPKHVNVKVINVNSDHGHHGKHGHGHGHH